MPWSVAIILWYMGLRDQLQASFLGLGIGLSGQSETKTCAAGRVVAGPQAAAMRFHDGAADPKSHTGPVRLSGEERIEDLVRLLRRKSHASVPDRNLNLLVVCFLRFEDEL